MTWTNGLGYRVQMRGGREVYEHRVIWEAANGPIPAGMVIDHVNGDRADNRLENLRTGTQAQNCQNRQGPQKNCGSGLIGAYFHKHSGRWHSRIQVRGKTTSLGYFDTAEEASAAYIAAKRKLHEFCTL